MSSSDQIVLLAFANAAVDDPRYLRDLRKEERELRDIIDTPEHRAKWKTEVRGDASADEIFAVFQDSGWQDRIALFHYGGHASPYALEFRADEGEGTLPAGGPGLAAFFHHQQALRLVFLNGCETKAIADELLNAGVPAVVGTSRAIDDVVARKFAKHFYRSLASGNPVRRAFDEAESATSSALLDPGSTLRKADAQFPGFRPIAERLHAMGEWPWKIYLRDEAAGNWRLDDDPLAGVPEPPRTLPFDSSPFRMLKPFSAEDARIFFGRRHEISGLYRLLAPDQTAVLLLYGATGAGKSSLLDAGLLPRVQGRYRPVYLRRSRLTGFGASLRAALQGFTDSKEEDIVSLWRTGESAGLPLLVIFDQAEEAFTRPRDGEEDEIAGLLGILSPLFARGVKARSRFVISFRKEWFAEIHKRVREAGFEHSMFFLTPLDRAGIVDAVEGLAHDKQMCAYYRLQITPGLGEIIASTLLQDREASIGPTLQILLADLWKAAEPPDGGERRFTSELFDVVRDRGLGLREFLSRQLATMSADPSAGAEVKAGLALDVLWLHTTALGTAETRSEDEVRRDYRHLDEQDVLRPLLTNLADLALLADPAQRRDDTVRTRLSHDALGPLVREAFQQSGLPGPRARRILDNWKANWGSQEANPPLLGFKDVLAVKRGQSATRVLDEQEAELVKRSFNRLMMIGCVVVATLIVITAITGLAAYQTYKGRQANAKALANAAKEQQAIVKARETAAQRDAEVSLKDTLTAQRFLTHGQPQEALAFLAHALRTDRHNRLAADRLFNLLTQRNWILPMRRIQHYVDFHSTYEQSSASDDSWTQLGIGASQNRTREAEMIDGISGRLAEKPIDRFSIAIDFDTNKVGARVADGWRVATLVSGSRSGLQVWNLPGGKAISEMLLFSCNIPAPGVAWELDIGRLYLREGEGGPFSVWDAREGQARYSPSPSPPSLPAPTITLPAAAPFDPPQAATRDNQFVLASRRARDDNSVWLVEVASGRGVAELDHGARIGGSALFGDGMHAVTGGRNDGRVLLWDLSMARNGKGAATFGQPILCDRPVRCIAVSPDNRLIAAGVWGKESDDIDAASESVVLVWDAATQQPIIDPILLPGTIRSVEFDASSASVIVKREILKGDQILEATESWDVSCGPLGSEGAPDWLCLLAEATGGAKVAENGSIEWTTAGQRQAMIDESRKDLTAVSPPSDPIARFGTWFLADRSSRTISPHSTYSTRDFLIAQVKRAITAPSIGRLQRASLVRDSLLQAAGNPGLATELHAVAPEVLKIGKLSFVEASDY